MDFNDIYVWWSEKYSNKTDDDVKQKIRIKVKAFDHKIIDRAARTIIDTAKRTNAEIKGRSVADRNHQIHRQPFHLCA